MEIWLAVVCGLFGLLFGSFGNVAVHRIPAGESVVTPRSACPGCGTPIAPRDNIPVVSWILLRGRCRHCGMRISARYPLIELACGLLFAAVALRFGFDWALPAYLLFAWYLLVVSVIDAQVKRIPNRLSYPITPALALLLVAAGLLNGVPGAALRALLGALAVFAFLLVLALISPRGMGMGDVKLGAGLGLALGYLGWGHVVAGIFAGFGLGAMVSIVLLVLRRKGRKELIPFGPYLAAGSMLAVLAGEHMIAWYLGVSGLA